MSPPHAVTCGTCSFSSCTVSFSLPSIGVTFSRGVTTRRARFNVDSESSGCAGHHNMRGSMRCSSDVAVHSSESAQVDGVLVMTASSAKTKLADELHVALNIEVFNQDVSTKTCVVRKCMKPSNGLLSISVISAPSFVKSSGFMLKGILRSTPGVRAARWPQSSRSPLSRQESLRQSGRRELCSREEGS